MPYKNECIKNTKEEMRELFKSIKEKANKLPKSTINDDIFWDYTYSLINDLIQLRACGSFLDGITRIKE